MSEETINKGKNEVTKENISTSEDELTIEDEFEEYLKKDIPESQPED